MSSLDLFKGYDALGPVLGTTRRASLGTGVPSEGRPVTWAPANAAFRDIARGILQTHLNKHSTDAQSLKKTIQALVSQRRPVAIAPKDTKEMFTKGSGPGGQAVNKTSNAVCLVHIPTGIQVRSHKTRYLEINRRDARKLLENELDKLINGPASKENIAALKLRERHRVSARKSRKKHGTDSAAATHPPTE